MIDDKLRAAYGEATGAAGDSATVTRLPGGAGNRTYWRVSKQGDASVVVMELPAEPARSEEASKPEPARELPFLNVRRYLARLGMRVPALLVDRSQAGYLVLEDLGDVTFGKALQGSADWGAMYGKAIDVIAGVRARAEQAPDAGCVAFGRAFDFDLYQWEFEHFIEYGLLGRGARPGEAELAELRRAFTAVSRELYAAPRGFTHRDYQSSNIMVLPTGEQVVIDFQDALLGPRQYDLVALLRDSYVELERPMVEEMLRRYLRAFAEAGGGRLPEAEFIGFFDLLTVQRKLKDAGRFVFIDRVKKNPSFLVHIPPSLRYVKGALARRPELAAAREILARHVPELR